MKKTVIALFLLVSIANFFACTPEYLTNPNNPLGLTASKTAAIKIGEPVGFSVSNALPGSIVTWAVTPSANVQIKNSGTSASILFSKSGNYAVNARYGSLSSNQSVVVGDSLFNGGSTTPIPVNDYKTLALTNEELTITVSNTDSTGGSPTGSLVFKAETKNTYCPESILTITTPTNSLANTSDITIEALNVLQRASCTGSEKLIAYTGIHDIANGKHNLTYKMNGITYTGSFTREGNKYTFTWPYTIGVKLTYKA